MPDSAVMRGTVAGILRAAASGQLPKGWLFLSGEDIDADTQCVLLSEIDIQNVQAAAESLGFPNYGLDTHFLRIIAQDLLLRNPPTEGDVLRAYVDQLSLEARVSRDFYESLGHERPDVPCRSTGCMRGAIALSVLCKRHHFESVQNRPCPVRD